MKQNDLQQVHGRHQTGSLSSVLEVKWETGRLEKCTDRNFLNFSKGKQKVLYLCQNKATQQYRMSTSYLENSLLEKGKLSSQKVD